MFADRVNETTTTTGTGTISLDGGAFVGHRRYSDAFTTGTVVAYCINGGVEWEAGYGTLTSGSPWTLSRDTVLSSSNGGAAVSFSAGTKQIFNSFPSGSMEGVWVDVASGVTTNIFAAQTAHVRITGIATITAFDVAPSGIERVVRFAGSLTLTHNATSLILPGAANITTAAGDVGRFVSLGSGNWVCVNYATVSGFPVSQPTATTHGALVNGATSKTTPVDADEFGLVDSAAANILKKLTWANLQATLAGLFAGLGANTFTGDQSLGGNQIINAKFKQQSEVKTAPSISSGTLTLDLSTANFFAVALNAAITTLTISNPVASGSVSSFTLEFTADGTARAVTWGAVVKWPGGTAPTLTSTNAKRDVFAFYTYDAGSTWAAFTMGQNL